MKHHTICKLVLALGLGLTLLISVTGPGCGGPPTLLYVDPNTGSTQGGLEVSIVGENFAQGATVMFGEDPAEIVSTSSTLIKAMTPTRLGKGGLVDVTVTNPQNNAAVLEDGFRYYFESIQFAAPKHISLSNGPYYWLKEGDFTGDGVNDIVVGGNVRVALMVNDGSGNFAQINQFSTPTGFDGIDVGDFNKDGKLDAVTSNWTSSSTYTIFLGNGDGTLQTGQTYAAGGAGVELEAGDLNGDGITDVISGLHQTNLISVALGVINGSLATPKTFQVQSAPTHTAIGDLNGDGKLDLAVANYSGNSMTSFLGDGTGSFTVKQNIASGGTRTYGVDVADFNKDDVLDVALANDGSNNVGILLGNGDGTFQSALTVSSAGSRPTNLGVDDFNHDGVGDIAVNNYSSNLIAFLEGKGDGSFKSPQTFTTQSGPYKITVGDLNGDGSPDIATANYNASSVTVVLNISK